MKRALPTSPMTRLPRWGGFLLGLLLLWSSLNARADLAALNRNRGIWDLNGNYAPYWACHPNLSEVGFTAQNTASASVPYWRTINVGTILNPRNATLLECPVGFTNAQYLELNQYGGPNGPAGATYTNDWTLVMDVRFPAVGNWISLLQDVPSTTGDAEIFINPSAGISFIGAGVGSANGVIAANTWYRLAFRAKYNATTGLQELRAFINGSPAGAAVTIAPDGIYGLTSSVYLFTDNNNETSPLGCNSLGFWSEGLSDADILNIGGFSSGGVSYTGLPSVCPVPALTGKLYFNDFLTTFTPANVPFSNLTYSTDADGVAKGELNFNVDDGKIPGMPYHTFGNRVPVTVLANGDCRAAPNIPTPVRFLPPGGTVSSPDIDSIANVIYQRWPISLIPGIGAQASAVFVTLPAGFSVAVAEGSRRNRANAGLANVLLKALLVPKTNLTLDKKAFTAVAADTGNIYPSVDRVPVTWTTPSIDWNPTSGKFTYYTSGQLIHHRELEYIALSGVATGLNATRASNDLYFDFARSSNVNVIISARADSVAAVDQMQFSLDPTKFAGFTTAAMIAHYPLGLTLGWSGVTGSTFTILADQVQGTSKVTTPTTASILYNQGCASPGCDTPDAPAESSPVASVNLTPSAAGWSITPDGGMRADVTTNTTFFRWGAYTQNSATQYAHTASSGSVLTGRALMSGNAVKGTEVASIPIGQRPAALLMTGYSAPSSPARLERPSTPEFLQGIADYPGLNLRTGGGGPATAVSRLAGSPTAAYNLRNTSKYYLSAGGVSGKHDSENGGTTTFVSGGTTYTVSALRLGFIDSQNVSSGVAGSLTVPAPANFSLTFSGLRFGCRGDLLGATMTTGQGVKVLSYWNAFFTPLAIGFGQPKTCPPADPSTSFLSVSMRADFPALATTGAVGTMGFYSGDIVTETEPVVGGVPVALGTPGISRFATSSNITIPGPQGETWSLQPTSGIYLNRYALRDTGSGSPDATVGTVNVAGMLNVPFFVDTPVLVGTSCSSTATGTTALAMRNLWTENGVPGPQAKVFDPSHRGRPNGLDLLLYRATKPAPTVTDLSSFALYDVHLQKKWLDIVNLDFSVRQDATRRFASAEIDASDLVLFHLRRQVPRLTPKTAEIQFDGQATTNLLPQLNVSSLLADIGIAPTLPAALSTAATDLTALESVMGDTLEPLLKPALSTVATTRSGALYSAFAANTSTATFVTNLTTDISTLLDANTNAADLAGSWRREIAAKITQGRQAVQGVKTIVNTASGLLNLANAVRSIVAPGSAAAGALPSSVESARASLLSLLNDLETQFTTLEGAIGATPGGSNALTTALRGALGNNTQITSIVNAALFDLNDKWAAHAGDAAYFAEHSPAELTTDLTAALVDRCLANAFSSSATAVLRQYVGDPQMLLRQAFDDTLRQAQQTITKALDDAVGAGSETLGLGSLSSGLGSARIQGYAQINGDSLNELRLDGQLRLKLPDASNSMNFDGHCLIRSLDSTTPDAACLVAGGAKTEVAMSAATEMQWGLRKSSLSLGGKVLLGSTGAPVGIAGDIALGGEFDFEAIKLNELKFGFGAGAQNAYVYGRAAGTLEAMSVAAGIFIGQTCDVSVIKHADPNIGDLLAHPSMGLSGPGNLPLTGAMAYAEGSMSLMPIIGIPPSCVLDLRVGGGQGYFGFLKPNGLVAGVKQSMSISGELLCLVDVGGTMAYVLAGNATLAGGKLTGFSLDGSATATVTGEVGYSPFSWDFEKSLTLRVHATPFDWSLDY